ncbi:MAG: EutN/CcmL family microcompartment protein [Gemmataceae bacterium]
MQLGKVVGHATSTIKHSTLYGFRLMIVQPISSSEVADGEPILAIDTLGAGIGMKVLLTTDAVLVRELVGKNNSPIRFAVMGLLDEPSEV